MLRAARLLMLVGILMLGLMRPAMANIFDGFYSVEGIVNSVQPSFFTIMGKQNTVTRVLIKPGEVMPPQILAGYSIRVIVGEDQYGNLYLDQVDDVGQQGIQPLPPVIIVVPK